jgi:hypothetical protein
VCPICDAKIEEPVPGASVVLHWCWPPEAVVPGLYRVLSVPGLGELDPEAAVLAIAADRYAFAREDGCQEDVHGAMTDMVIRVLRSRGLGHLADAFDRTEQAVGFGYS